MNVLKHGENKNIIDGLNNKAYLDAPRRWTHMLQEQGKSIGQTEGNDDVLKWKPRVETPSR
jgi:hypothetical protein